MDFLTASAAPVPVRINGTEYQVPRFLLAQFKQWAASRAKSVMDEAAKELPDADARSRFKLFWQCPPQDVAALANELRSPDGVEYVLMTCLKRGGVPDELVVAMLANGDPVRLRALADELASVRQAVAQMDADSNEPGDAEKNRQSGAPHTSDASQPTGDGSSAASHSTSGEIPTA